MKDHTSLHITPPVLEGGIDNFIFLSFEKHLTNCIITFVYMIFDTSYY